MKKSLCGLLSTILIALLCVCAYPAKADISKEARKDNKVMRESHGVWDYQLNTASNISFPVTNHGTLFHNSENNSGEGYWPGNSTNRYLFGAGIWFGAKKYHTEYNPFKGRDTSYYRKYVELGYNPHTGASWFIPGRIEDGDIINPSKTKSYRVYFSTDMDETGKPFESGYGPYWPVWRDNDYMEYYIYDENQRNFANNSNGPAFESDEDIFCTYKDTDLDYFEGNSEQRDEQGYPLGLQFEQSIYSWGEGSMNNSIIIYYKAINTSSDTLFSCWFCPVFDTDLSVIPDPKDESAENDRANYYSQEDSLNLVYTWTDTDCGEEGKGFGYMGFSLISSPAVDDYGFVRHDKSKYDSEEQLGMVTFRNCRIEMDPKEDATRYDFIAASVIDDDDGSGDWRLMIASGPFNMLPGDTVEMAISINMAMPDVNDEADGSFEDIAGLVESVKTSRKTFFNKLLPNIVEENYPEKNDLLIYPNPADDYINVTFSSGSASKVLVEITDVLGNSFYSGKEIMNTGKNDFSIDTKDLQSGVYYLIINDGKNSFTKILNIIK